MIPGVIIEERPAPAAAVAAGNASLLGIGYLLLGRRGLAVGTGFVTLVLVILSAAVFRSGWFEVVVLLWWAGLVGHGWLLARRADATVSRRGRGVAFTAAIVVVAVVGLLRYDAAQIDNTLDDARAGGGCEQAREAVDQLWLGHHIADAPMTARADATVEACRKLDTAEGHFATALDSTDDDVASYLGFGFGQLNLALRPGHEPLVEAALTGFLDRIPTDKPCLTASITSWLRERPATGNLLDRAADVVPRLAPPALLACGAELIPSQQFDAARKSYQQLIDQYPGHPLAADAEKGVLAVELAEIRTSSYCIDPKPYRGARPYGNGVNRAVFPGGDDKHIAKLPGAWRTTDYADAVLVVCVGAEEHGAVVDTCFYERKPGDLRPPLLPGQVDPGHEVTFHKLVLPVKVYELRTAKLVTDTKLTIGGASCPKVLNYETYVRDLGPPGKVAVTPSPADLRAAFQRVIVRG